MNGDRELEEGNTSFAAIVAMPGWCFRLAGFQLDGASACWTRYWERCSLKIGCFQNVDVSSFPFLFFPFGEEDVQEGIYFCPVCLLLRTMHFVLAELHPAP